jgi:UDP-glucose 4-epimerase
MKRVMVTGATTPLGRALVGALLEDPGVETVLAVGREPDGLQALPQGRLQYAAVDLSRPRSVRNLMFGPARALGIEGLIHTALHRSAADGGRRVHRINVQSTRDLLGLAERHPTIRRFVFRSCAHVYQAGADQPVLIDEGHPLDLGGHAPQWVADRVAADVTVCTRMGLSPLSIAVLRCSEIVMPEMGSQLWDYLSSRVCLRPLGYDPMMNLQSPEDAVRACLLALRSTAQGVFNVPGADTLPLTRAIALAGRVDLALPGPLLSPLYRARAGTLGMEFRYDLNHRRFHFSAVLDGRRAREILGYQPCVRLPWASETTQSLRRSSVPVGAAP